MTALRFQTGGSHQTSPACLRGEEGDDDDDGNDIDERFLVITHSYPSSIHYVLKELVDGKKTKVTM